MRNRAGFTLVEAIVAIVVLSVGVLAVLASGSAAARVITDAHRDEFLVSAITGLSDSLAIAGANGSGTVTTGGAILDWTASISPDSLTRTIRVSGRLQDTSDSVLITTVRLIR